MMYHMLVNSLDTHKCARTVPRPCAHGVRGKFNWNWRLQLVTTAYSAHLDAIVLLLHSLIHPSVLS